MKITDAIKIVKEGMHEYEQCKSSMDQMKKRHQEQEEMMHKLMAQNAEDQEIMDSMVKQEEKKMTAELKEEIMSDFECISSCIEALHEEIMESESCAPELCKKIAEAADCLYEACKMAGCVDEEMSDDQMSDEEEGCMK